MNAAFDKAFDVISGSAAPPTTIAVGRPEAATGPKPPWSVVSLRRLLDAVREDARLAPARHAERLGRDARALAETRVLRAAAAERAWADRYRNAWENS